MSQAMPSSARLAMIFVARFCGEVVEVFGDDDAHGMDVGIGDGSDGSAAGIPVAVFERGALGAGAEAVAPEVFVVGAVLEHVEIDAGRAVCGA